MPLFGEQGMKLELRLVHDVIDGLGRRRDPQETEQAAGRGRLF
jgi:hypothetical protein